jgi:hypothetical protein
MAAASCGGSDDASSTSSSAATTSATSASSAGGNTTSSGSGGSGPNAGTGTGAASATSSGSGGAAPACDSGEPLETPAETWTYVSIPGTECGNGSPAALVINPTRRSRHLLVALEGGGACFNEGDCGSSFLDGINERDVADHIFYTSLFERDLASNPFADYSYVYVPYCTGDFHSGSAVSSFGVHHAGYTNMKAFLTRIVPTFCDADHVVVTGFSAGGFGATFNYVQVHEAFGSLPVDLIDDSGPYMQPPWMPLSAQDMMDASWNYRANMPPDCDDCASGWHALYAHGSARYPNDRISLVSALWDYSIQERFAPYTPLDSLDDFQIAIDAFADEIMIPLPNARVFYIPDNGHVYLPGALDEVVVGGVSLEQFVRRQIDDDPGWANVRP